MGGIPSWSHRLRSSNDALATSAWHLERHWLRNSTFKTSVPTCWVSSRPHSASSPSTRPWTASTICTAAGTQELRPCGLVWGVWGICSTIRQAEQQGEESKMVRAGLAQSVVAPGNALCFPVPPQSEHLQRIHRSSSAVLRVAWQATLARAKQPVPQFGGLVHQHRNSAHNRAPSTHSLSAWQRSEERRVGKECRSRWSP